jgi:chaperonin GroEL (HSP60 family)
LERIWKILATGANVILTTKGINDLCLKEFVEASAMAVRRCRKEDFRCIAKATGVLDEMERALHDMLSIVKRTLESGRLFQGPGGGAVESALSTYLENFATILVRISYVVLISIANHCDTLGFEGTTSHRGVCQCLALHPKTLAVNTAKDSTELVAKLRSYHNAADSDDEDEEDERPEDGDQEVAEEDQDDDLVIGGDASRNTKAKSEKDIVSPHSIDGFWVQRQISKVYPDPVTAADKAASVLSILVLLCDVQLDDGV